MTWFMYARVYAWICLPLRFVFWYDSKKGGSCSALRACLSQFREYFQPNHRTRYGCIFLLLPKFCCSSRLWNYSIHVNHWYVPLPSTLKLGWESTRYPHGKTVPLNSETFLRLKISWSRFEASHHEPFLSNKHSDLPIQQLSTPGRHPEPPWATSFCQPRLSAEASCLLPLLCCASSLGACGMGCNRSPWSPWVQVAGCSSNEAWDITWYKMLSVITWYSMI